MKFFSRYIKEFLTFAKWEQRGIFCLVILIVLLVLFSILYKPKYQLTVTPDIQAKISDFEQQVLMSEKEKSDRFNSRWSDDSFKRESDYVPFKFDPNTASLEDFEALGFTCKQAQVLLNYRNKGGRFKKPEDFKRSFVVSEEHYNRLFAFIEIKDSPDLSRTSVVGEPKKIFQRPIIDINSADTSELKSLKGVGSVIAQRIVIYRKRLGGFSRIGQLLEVYGVDSARFALFSGQVRILTRWSRWNINSSDEKVLKACPYLTPYQVRNILYFRNKKGAIKSLQQLVENRLISKLTSDRLEPYVEF